MYKDQKVKPNIVKVINMVNEIDRKVNRLQGDMESIKKALNEIQQQKRIRYANEEDLPQEEKSSGWFFS
tara:strand:+ start:3937 stop:4143 length:207 start_codon:yes stop_codon:yes gene_type:complete